MSPARASRRAAIAIDLLREGDCVWLLGADPRQGKEPIIMRIELPPGELDVAANIVRRGSLTDISEEILAKLCSAIAMPLGETCRDAGVLALAPHGCLHLLPIGSGAIDGGEPLAAALPVAHMPSTSYLRRISRANLPGFSESAALMVGPEIPGDSAVERAAAEIESALNRIGMRTEILTKPRKLKPETVLIIAAHGRPAKLLMRMRAGRSEWIPAERFADSIGRPAFAALAVCRSGTTEVAPDDEPLGLVWPLLANGSHAVVSSLWDVSAPAAAEFVGTLLKQALGGEKIGDAFASASAQQMSNPRLPCLRDRGGFVLHGDWRLSIIPR